MLTTLYVEGRVPPPTNLYAIQSSLLNTRSTSTLTTNTILFLLVCVPTITLFYFPFVRRSHSQHLPYVDYVVG